jgi:UDP-GlcNAc:undecaprenyl-phosphate/decaprenyl-phosphate GlcNAc-1-phosphate transferase
MAMMLVTGLMFLAGACVATLLLIRWLRTRGLGMLVLDVPSERSSHALPIPRGGGIALVVVVLTALGVFQLTVAAMVDWRTFVIFVSGAGFVALIGWLDDVHGLGRFARFVAQSLAALNAIAVFGYWHDVAFPVAGIVHLGFMGLPFTVLWVVGLTNAYNFIDGADGLAASQAIVSGLFCALLGLMLESPIQWVFGLSMAGACAGFLVYNWTPARIFMGDVGSIFIGYSFAIIMVHAGRNDPHVVLAAGLIFGVVIMDTGLTFVRRLLMGERVFDPHRSHLYQRLVVAGWRHRSVALLYGAAGVGFGGLAILWVGASAGMRVLVAGAAAAVFSGILWIVRRAERSSDGLEPGRARWTAGSA